MNSNESRSRSQSPTTKPKRTKGKLSKIEVEEAIKNVKEKLNIENTNSQSYRDVNNNNLELNLDLGIGLDLGEVDEDVSIPAEEKPLEVEEIEAGLQNECKTHFNFEEESKVCQKSQSTIKKRDKSQNIEIFFGTLVSFEQFYEIYCIKDTPENENVDNQPQQQQQQDPNDCGRKMTICPVSIKRLSLVGHPLKSLGGLDHFPNLLEIWVTNCLVQTVKWEDLECSKMSLQKLYLNNCRLKKIEQLEFENLKVLWLTGNKITDISFLGEGLPCLIELNLALNKISHLAEDHLKYCTNLEVLNLSGNPIYSVPDLQAVRILPRLRSLFLSDPTYGKCPIMYSCESSTILLGLLRGGIELDGRTVSPEEIIKIKDYIHSRAMFYYANSVKGISNQMSLRRSLVGTMNSHLELVGNRICHLLSLQSRCRSLLENIDCSPTLPNSTVHKIHVKEQSSKIETRIQRLREETHKSIRRYERMMQISKWEQEVEKWLKWIEFKSYGNLEFQLTYSVHTSREFKDPGHISSTVHQLISSLACQSLWPQNTLMKIETVIALKHKGLEAGMENTFDEHFVKKTDLKYVEQEETGLFSPTTSRLNTLNFGTMLPFTNYPQSNPQTYTDENYTATEPLHPFPESIQGLPERATPLFLFLIPPPSASTSVHCSPLEVLQKILSEKSQLFKEIRLTNCLWLVSSIYHQQNQQQQQQQPRPKTKSKNSTSNLPHSSSTTTSPNLTTTVNNEFCQVLVVKVLEECLQQVEYKQEPKNSLQHSWDCRTFKLTKRNSFTPAYLVNLSFNPEEKKFIWKKSISDDKEVVDPAESLLRTLNDKLEIHNAHTGSIGCSAETLKAIKFCRKESVEGFLGDLSAIPILSCEEKAREIEKYKMLNNCPDPDKMPILDLHNLAEYFGPDISRRLTFLDISGNKLRLLIGLEGLPRLKKLNISCNELMSFSGLHKLPDLYELKAGWNKLRFIHTNLIFLGKSAPNLRVLELLPNPFLDLRDLSHVPLIVSRVFVHLEKVDIWTRPFDREPVSSIQFPMKNIADSGFVHLIFSNTRVRVTHTFSSLRSRCLTSLEAYALSLPDEPNKLDKGVDLNLSDNYLTAFAIGLCPFMQKSLWRESLVKIQLQENMISTLNWMRDLVFPNAYILDLSYNLLTKCSEIATSCPELRHLHLSCNPLGADITILTSLNGLKNLKTLEMLNTPLSTHPEYPSVVIKTFPKVKILDGLSISSWEISGSVQPSGGILSLDFIEEKLSNRDWNSLKHLSLPNCALQRISFQSKLLPKLTTLDLTDNNLTNLSNLSSLMNLKVLVLSYNNVTSLGSSTCPQCHPHTSLSQNPQIHHAAACGDQNQNSAAAGQLHHGNNNNNNNNSGKTRKSSKSSSINNLSRCGTSTTINSSHSHSQGPKVLFPKLEVLILSHNSISEINSLHLHSMPSLKTLIMNCNNITSLEGLEEISELRAIVLDNNKIRDLPFTCLSGCCKSLRFLHLEHNRITAIPRLPHLTNLTSLHLANNKIQSLGDAGVFSGSSLIEMSLGGTNPLSSRSDYRLMVATSFAKMSHLDGKSLAKERIKLKELTNELLSKNVVKNSNHSLSTTATIDKNNNGKTTNSTTTVKKVKSERKFRDSTKSSTDKSNKVKTAIAHKY